VTPWPGGARTEVEVAYGDDEVRVRVQDDGARVGSATGGPQRGQGGDRTGAGRGVRGIRDRVAALGGTAEIGPDPHGGWAVRCTLRTDR
jgi:signal transduction histidine kinase